MKIERALIIDLWEFQFYFSFINLSGVSLTLKLLYFHENLRGLDDQCMGILKFWWRGWKTEV